MNRLSVSFLSFTSLFLTFAVIYLGLNVHALNTGAYVSLNVPFLSFGLPSSAHANAAAQPAVPETRQFTLFLTMIKDAEGEEHHRWFPNALFVNQGDTVILRVTNTDADAAHGFGIAGYGIFDAGLAPGMTKVFQFTAANAGIFHFACALPDCANDHADQEGQLIVLAR
jgi:heme/copper-type cytochrome/quinol oxidase subunit 2